MAHFIALPKLTSSSSSLVRLNSLDLAGNRVLMDGDCSAAPIVSNLFQALDLARETGSVETSVASSSSSQFQATLESGPAPLNPRRVVDLAHSSTGRGSRLIEAVQNGDVERVRALLERGKMSEQEAAEAVKVAANSGHREIAELLAAPSDAAEPAAPEEDQAVLEEEWVSIDFLAQDHFERIAEECDVPALRMLSATSKKIREFCLGTRSMMAGFTRGVIRALEAGNRDEAVARAAQIRAFGGALVRELSEYEMPRRVWSEAAWNHVLQMDDPEILSAFISSTNMPSDWIQGSRLLIEAAKSGNRRVVEDVLSQERYLDSRSLAAALLVAAERGDEEIVKALLAKKAIGMSDKISAIKAAGKAGHTEVVRVFLIDAGYFIPMLTEVFQAMAEGAENLTEILEQLIKAKKMNQDEHYLMYCNESSRRNAIRAAIRRGYNEIAKVLFPSEKILQERGWYAREERTSAIEASVESGNLGMLRWLQPATLSEKERGKAVVAAARAGHLKIMRALLDSGEISQADRDFAIKESADRRDSAMIELQLLATSELPRSVASEIAQFMMQDVKLGQKILEYLLLQPRYAWGIRHALNQAIAEGYREIVRVLGSSEELDGVRSEAIWTAAEKRDLEMVRMLRPENLSISARGTVTIQAAGLDSLEMIEALVSSGEISRSSRDSAIRAAAKRGDVKMIKLLEPEKLSEEKRGLAIWQIAQEEGASLAVVQALIRSGGISGRFAYRTWAIEAAAKRGDVKMVQLLEPEKLSQKERGEAISTIVQEGATLEVIRLLLQSGEITLETRGLAIVNAAKKGDLEMIKLLEPEKVLEEERGPAVGNAVERGDLEMVQVLLGSGQIADISRWLASHDAAKKKDLKILEALLISAGRFSQPVISQLLQVAEQGNSGLYDIFRCLLYPAKRTEDERDSALKAAEKGRYTEIANLLRTPMQRIASAVKDIVYPDFPKSSSSGNRAGVSSAPPQRAENRNTIARMGARGDVPDRWNIVMSVAFGALIAAGAYALTRGSGHSNAVAKIVGDFLGRFSKR